MLYCIHKIYVIFFSFRLYVLNDLCMLFMFKFKLAFHTLAIWTSFSFPLVFFRVALSALLKAHVPLLRASLRNNRLSTSCATALSDTLHCRKLSLVAHNTS